jgi:hypothetical protein
MGKALGPRVDLGDRGARTAGMSYNHEVPRRETSPARAS